MANYRDIKFRMTPQRAAIIKYLEGNESHPSAEDIFEAVRVEYPMLSLATVYNTLDTLKEMGMLWELSIDDERKRYDPNTSTHHHLICTRCKKVVDVLVEFELELAEVESQGFEITGRHVDFYGVCPECRGRMG